MSIGPIERAEAAPVLEGRARLLQTTAWNCLPAQTSGDERAGALGRAIFMSCQKPGGGA